MKAFQAIRFILLSAVLLTALFFLSTSAQAQEQNNIGTIGLGYSSTADPGIVGFGAYGRKVADKTILFTDFDVYRDGSGSSNFSVAGLRLKYSIRTGLAYKLFRVTNSWSVYGLFNGGIAADGISVARSLQYGGFVDKSIGKNMGVMLILAAEDNPITQRDFAPRVGWRFKF
jgi:hypothetical protein